MEEFYDRVIISEFYMSHSQQNILKHIGQYAYNLGNLLGKGYSSSVYKGMSTITHEQLAIKVIVLQSVQGDIPRSLLANELRALKQLSHANVIRTHDICQTANNMYIVSEFCNQGDLLSILKRGLTEEQVLEIFSMIVEGLVYVCEKGIVHRDIKPANILMREGVAKLCDFGFCAFFQNQHHSIIAENFSVGSPLYMSPEAYRKNHYSVKSDIWAAGITLYEMLLGEQPFKGLSYDMLVRAAMEVPRTVKAGDFTRCLLSKMLCIEPEARITPVELMWQLRNHKAMRLQQVQLVIQNPSREFLAVPGSSNHLRSTHQRIGSNQIIGSTTVIRGNSLTTANPNIFTNCVRPNNLLVPPSPKQERSTSIQKALDAPSQPSTNRTALGDISNRTSQNVTRSPPKLKRTSSSKAMSINQINVMHRHLVGMQPTTNVNLSVRQFQTSTGNLAKRSSANFCRPVKQHVVHSWVQLCRLLRKLLNTLGRFLPKPTELIMFDEPDAFAIALGHIFTFAYKQLNAASQQLGKLAKGVSSPSRSTSTNENSEIDNPALELEAAESSLSTHRRLQQHLNTYEPANSEEFFTEEAIVRLRPYLVSAIRELEHRLSQEQEQLAYVYLLKYYETLDVVKGRRSEDMVAVAGLDRLLSSETIINQETMQSARTLAAVLIR